MSTRCNIRVILKEEDRNKDLKFNPGLIKEFDENDWGADQIKVENGMWDTVNPNGGKALYIYSHWDGYPEGGVGETLVDDYDTYEKALNLVLVGDISSMCGKLSPYSLRSGENWDDIKPESINEDKPCKNDYDYMFKDDKWYFRSYGDTKWRDLKKYLSDSKKN